MREFLISQFGENPGVRLFELQQKRLARLVAETKGKSKNQMKTLTKTILPRIALYQVLLEVPTEQPEAYRVIQKYLIEVVCDRMKKSYRLFEKLPAFYSIFRKIFTSSVVKSDNWDSKLLHSDREYFSLDIHKCLWYDACAENKCPEICRLFCECDDINFGSLRKIAFIRNGSIGLGQSKCDFTFKAVRKSRGAV